jgi:pimeloyl-ACP methyl ester carboxylesterase
MKLEVISREPESRRFLTPLLFVHGTGHAAWAWDEYFLPYFAENGFSSHAVSLRGHGNSEGHDKLKWTSIADYVADVFQTASELSTSPVVIGHSVGGLVAQKYLENHQAPAAILMTPPPSEGMFRSGFRLPFKYPWLFTKIAFYQDYSIMFSTPHLARKFLFSAQTDEAKIVSYVKRFGKESYRANLESIYQLPKSELIKTEMLVLGTENDALVSLRAIEKTARVYRADCQIFMNMGHNLLLEHDWRSVADFMIGWLEKKIQ